MIRYNLEPEDTWTRLEARNDWGTDYFARPGHGLTPAGCHDSRLESVEPLLGTKVPVRFKDGAISEATVVSRHGSYSVSDMGRSSSGSFKTWQLQVPFHGGDLLLSPSDVELPSGFVNGAVIKRR